MPEGCKACMNDAKSASYSYAGASSGGAPQRRVQVTAKILFGSVSEISNMKKSEKANKTQRPT